HHELLVAAELSRVTGDDRTAALSYERALSSAHANGFTHDEAVAAERAGEYYLARGLPTAAAGYFARARDAYQRWGAVRKVAQLDARRADASEDVLYSTEREENKRLHGCKS